MKKHNFNSKHGPLKKAWLLLVPLALLGCTKEQDQSLSMNESAELLLKNSKEYFADKTVSPFFNTSTSTYNWEDAEIVIDLKTFASDGEVLKNDVKIEDKWGNYEIMQDENIKHFVKVPVEISNHNSRGKAYVYFYPNNGDYKKMSYMLVQYFYKNQSIIDSKNYKAFILRNNKLGNEYSIIDYKNGNKSIQRLNIPVLTKTDFCEECCFFMGECPPGLVFNPEIEMCVQEDDYPSGNSYFFENICPIHGGIYAEYPYANGLPLTISSSDNNQVTGSSFLPINTTTINVECFVYGAILPFFSCWVTTMGQEVRKTRLTIPIVGYGSTTLNPTCSNTYGTFGFQTTCSNGGTCTFYN